MALIILKLYKIIIRMTTKEIANRLVELCRLGNYEQAVKELYSPNIMSVEPEGVPDRIVSGFEAIAKKGKAFEARIESINSAVVTDPIIADNIFSFAMLMNVNLKGVPSPIDLNEICVYNVEDSKIIKEEFFYKPQDQVS